MSVAKSIIEGLEEVVGVPNAFGSEDLDMEELMDDDSEEELENISDNYPNGEII